MIGRVFKFGMLLAAFVILAGISTYGTLSFFIKGEAKVVVPKLTGKNVVTALELLSDLS